MGCGMLLKLTVAVAVVMLAVGEGTAVARSAWEPTDDTITFVEGTRRSGFHVEYYDGSEVYLPTLTEALTECTAYRQRVDRVRCKVAVRTSYRGLGDTKRAIWFARRR